MKRSLLLLIPVALAVFGWQRSNNATPISGWLFDNAVVSVRIELGVNDTQPRAWDGSIVVSGGEILAVRDWHPRPENKISKNSWSMATVLGSHYARRVWEEELETEPAPYLWIPGIIVDVKGSSATRLSVSTKNGNFTVRPFELKANPVRLLDGAVVAERVPSAQMVSVADSQNDFAAILTGPGGELWTTWVSYTTKQDQVVARRYDGTSWSSLIHVTEKPGDVFLARIGRAKNGVWIVWSAQVDGNWDLYGRRFDGKAWTATERLTTGAQPDINHNLATDSNGNLWLVWQGFRNGKSDIFTRRYDGTSWSAEEAVSTSPANDWEPAIAADGAGRVYVAWDTYDKGNYDIALRRFERGSWSPVMSVAETPKFEAHVSLACDRQDRLWATWNESGMQWGKDAGFLVKKEATRLYQSRQVAVAVYTGNEWLEPATDFQASLAEEMGEYNDRPTLVADANGRMWMFFRHRTVKFRGVHNNTASHRAAWEIHASAYSGERWTKPVAFPFSQGRNDMRAAFAADGDGGLYAAWPTDQRGFDEFLFQQAQIYAGRIPVPETPAAAPKLKPRRVPKLVTNVVHKDEPGDLARIRGYAIQSGGKTYHIYRGDTHRHTEFSMDGNNDGSLTETYRYAMDAAELDYLGVSDHNGAGGPDVDYVNWLGQKTADLLHLPGRFTPLFAYERSLNYPNGHRNVIFSRRGNPTLRASAKETAGEEGAGKLYAYLKQYSGIAISHTSATTMGTDWRDNDPEVEPLVEIYQGDRVSAEYEGAPKAANAANPASAQGGLRPAGFVWNAWAKGYKLGVQASSDHLSTHISYACTISPDGTRQGLLDAMRARHSYAATDNIILDYRLQTGGKEYLQGDIVNAPGEFKLVVKVTGTTAIRQIDIIRSNQFIHNRVPMEKEVNFTFVDQQPKTGESYYYVRVIQADDNMAWSSPIWVRR